MSRYKFCPVHGAPLETDEHEGGECKVCRRRWHDNPAPTVGAVIVKDDKALVTQRSRDPEKDRWDIPGGFLDMGEDPIEGLKRELNEELGVEIDSSVRDFVGISAAPYGDSGDFVVAIGFRAHVVSGEPQASDDVADFRWITVAEVDDVDFAWEHDRELVRNALTNG